MKYAIHLLLIASVAIPGLYIRHVLGIPPTEYQSFWITIIMLPMIIIGAFLPDFRPDLELFREYVVSVAFGFAIIVFNDILWKKYRTDKSFTEPFDD